MCTANGSVHKCVDVLCTNVIALETAQIVVSLRIKSPAETESKSKYWLAAAAARTTTELMMKEFVSADEPILVCTLHSTFSLLHGHATR